MLLNSLIANAFIYEGFLTDTNNVPQVGAVSLKLSIYFNSAKTCKVYEVTSDFTLADADQGYFKVDLNTAVQTAQSKNSSLAKVFQYKGTLTCSDLTTVTAGSFSSVARELEISIKNSGGTYDTIGSFSIYEIPRAMQAGNAEKFSDKLVTDFLTKDLIQTCQGGSFLQFNTTAGSFTCSTVVSNISSSDITTTLGFNPISSSGGTLSGSLTMGMGSPLVITGTSTSPPVGAIWYDATSKVIKFNTDVGQRTLSVANSGLQSINGVTASTISLNYISGGTGLVPYFSSDTSSGSISLKMPLAFTTGVTEGLISNTEFNSFKSKLDSTSGTMSGLLTVGTINSSGGTLNITNNVSVSGNVSGNSVSVGTSGLSFYNSNFAVTLRTPTLSANSNYTWPTGVPASNGLYLTSSTAGLLSWSAAGGGSVTSIASGVGLTGGPITTTGTLSVDVGTGINQIVQLDSSARLPAADGSLLTNLNLGINSTTGTLSVAKGGTGLSGGTSGGIPYYLSNNTLASSPVLSLNGIIYGGGAAGAPLSTAAMTDGQILVGKTGFAPQVVLINGDGVISTTGSLTLASVVSAGTYSKITVDAKGRAIAGSSISSSDVTDALGYTPATAGTLVIGSGLTGGPITSTNGTIAVNTGTGINQIVELNSSAQLPALDASLLKKLSINGSTLASTKIWVGTGSNTASEVSLSGDVTMSNIGVVTVGSVGGMSASDMAGLVLQLTTATSINTASTLIRRDGLGNFSAGTLSGNLVGNIVGNVTGSIFGAAASITNGTIANLSIPNFATIATLVVSGTSGFKLNPIPTDTPIATVACDIANEGRVIYKRRDALPGLLCMCVDTNGAGSVFQWREVNDPTSNAGCN
jgi:hypothetical protein